MQSGTTHESRYSRRHTDDVLHHAFSIGGVHWTDHQLAIHVVVGLALIAILCAIVLLPAH